MMELIVDLVGAAIGMCIWGFAAYKFAQSEGCKVNRDETKIGWFMGIIALLLGALPTAIVFMIVFSSKIKWNWLKRFERSQEVLVNDVEVKREVISPFKDKRFIKGLVKRFVIVYAIVFVIGLAIGVVNGINDVLENNNTQQVQDNVDQDVSNELREGYYQDENNSEVQEAYNAIKPIIDESFQQYEVTYECVMEEGKVVLRVHLPLEAVEAADPSALANVVSVIQEASQEAHSYLLQMGNNTPFVVEVGDYNAGALLLYVVDGVIEVNQLQ